MDQFEITTPSSSAEWWRGCVIYQVYPRSYQDANGDGIGDLAGIRQRLPYIASLGVDALWISPFFKSPMKDNGYDVSDYREIDPLFGTLKDFDLLLGEAHEFGLKVMIDLVLNHSSDQHPWFIESRKNRDNDKADWYVWADAKLDGTPPNNWLSVFGGSAWQWDTRRQQYYLHNFLVSQPDFNFHCPALQDALLDLTRFWLEKGVDGFRLDTINFYVHDAELRDNPALEIDQRNDSIAPSVNPYNYQNHLYSKNRPENLYFLKRFRSLLDEFEGRACLGEVGDAQRGLEILGQYTEGNERAHMCYTFELLQPHTVTPSFIRQVFERLDIVAKNGWPCWAYSNHDVMRHASRWKLSDAALKLHATLLMCLYGSACIYQGEELGLEEAEVDFVDLHDPYGIEFWPEFKGRDGCHTPMVWEKTSVNAGFSLAKPWLPVCPDQQQRAVSEQEHAPESLLNHYRLVIRLRHQHAALAAGDMKILKSEGAILGFLRRTDEETLYCVFNLSDETVDTSLPAGDWSDIGDEVGGAPIPEDGSLRLDAWQCAIVRKRGIKNG